MKPEKLTKQYQKIKVEYDQWSLAYNTYRRMLQYQSPDVVTEVFRQYILIGTLADTAKYLNENEITFRDGKFTSNKVSYVIDNYEITDKELMVAARFLLDAGRQAMNKLL